MFELSSDHPLSIQAEQEATALRRNTALHDLLHRLRGEPNTLPSFDLVQRLRPVSEHGLGVQTIEVDQIVGSVDRYSDFDHRFLPKEPHILQHWMDLRRKQLQGLEFPPIEVYKVGEVYFVKDGNHRTALAKAEGQQYIDAVVTEVEVVVPPDCCDTTKDLLLKAEYAQFLQTTKLDQLRPDHVEVHFTVLGRYDKLLAQIMHRQEFVQTEQRRAVSWEEAVCNWYDTLYLPTIQIIREQQMLSEFPGRTESDLALWVMESRSVLEHHGISAPEVKLALEQHAGHGLLGPIVKLRHRIATALHKGQP